jgi:hypothetical protein
MQMQSSADGTRKDDMTQATPTEHAIRSVSGSGSAPGSDAGIMRFYMSGDLRAATGLSRTQLDYYLREGLVLPTARTESGYLLFDEAEREIVERIIAWREEGVGLKDIRQRLDRDERP